jgi:hypothetical protein
MSITFGSECEGGVVRRQMKTPDLLAEADYLYVVEAWLAFRCLVSKEACKKPYKMRVSACSSGVS